jgi:hypothetical protein
MRHENLRDAVPMLTQPLPPPPFPSHSPSLRTTMMMPVITMMMTILMLMLMSLQPELERAKTDMLRQEEDFKVQLAGLEKDLLEALATAEGNILDNTSLIEGLSRTKEKAGEIQASGGGRFVCRKGPFRVPR